MTICKKYLTKHTIPAFQVSGCVKINIQISARRAGVEARSWKQWKPLYEQPLYSRNSSVGRASDWRSEGPWFIPGLRQNVFFANITINKRSAVFFHWTLIISGYKKILMGYTNHNSLCTTPKYHAQLSKHILLMTKTFLHRSRKIVLWN